MKSVVLVIILLNLVKVMSRRWNENKKIDINGDFISKLSQQLPNSTGDFYEQAEKLYQMSKENKDKLLSLVEKSQNKEQTLSVPDREEYRKSYDFVRAQDAPTKTKSNKSVSKKGNSKKDPLFQDKKKEPMSQTSVDNKRKSSLGTQKDRIGISDMKKDSSEPVVCLEKSDLKRAIIWKEILDKPVSLRH